MIGPATDDHHLMLAVRDGDLRQLGELFERHHRPLFNFFYRLTSDRPQSEDLVQLVFLRILKYRHTYRDVGDFRPWMYHLARMMLADHFRKHRRSDGLNTSAPLEEVPDHRPDSGEQIARRDEIELMQRAFARLEVDEREVLTLHRFQHLSHEEIAHVMGCTIGAAKVRTHRALKSLRAIYLRLANPQSLHPESL